MCLVDDHHVMLGQDVEVLQRVDGQQRMVGDDDVRPACLIPRQLREAPGAERAALGADAFASGNRDLPPGLLADTGHQLVPVAGRGRGRPLVQPLHLPPGRRDRAGVEEHLGGVLRRAR